MPTKFTTTIDLWLTFLEHGVSPSSRLVDTALHTWRCQAGQTRQVASALTIVSRVLLTVFLCYTNDVGRSVRWYRSARRHRIGKSHAMFVINSTTPDHVPATATADARLVWIGEDDQGIELEMVALDLDDAIVVVTSCRPP